MGRHWYRYAFIPFYLTLASAEIANAAPAALTYQGRIVNVTGTPLEHTSVSFQFEILNPSGSCVIYREQVNGINMKNSGGVFDVKIGASHSYPAAPSFSILDTFNNSGSFVCDGGVAYNPTLADGRLLRVQFYDGSAWRAITPDSVIRSVPFAAYAEATNRIGTHAATDFVLKTDVNGGAHCSGGSFLTWNATTQTFGCSAETGGGGGSGTVTELFSANSYLSIANSTTTPTLTLNVGTTANTVAAGNDVRLTNARIPTGAAGGDLGGNYPNPSVAKIQGVGVDFSIAPGTGEVLTFDGTNWVAQALPAASSGTVTGITAGTGLTGGTINTSGTIGLGTALSGLNSLATNGYIQRTGAGTYSTTSGNVAASNNTLVLRDGSGVSSFYGVGISGATSGNITLQAPLISGTYSLTLPDAQGAANQVMANDGNGILSWINVPAAPGAACSAGNVLTYNGTAFTCVPDQVGSSGGGIATLNSQTGSAQSFATGTTGTAPNWSSGSDVHTLHVPLARNAGVTAGLISKTEYDSFNSKQNALGFTPLAPANNLSELTDASAARTNLGLGTAALKNAPASGNAGLAEVVLGDDTRLSNSRTPSGAAGGDLGGTYPNPDVNRLKGVGLSMTSLTSGNFLKYNGTNWINSLIDPSDVTGLVTALGSKIDQSQIVGTCSSSKTLVFSSVTGSWTCTDISIAGSQVAYASQTQNYVFAAPSTGNGAPTFRALADTDLPTAVQNALWTASSANIYRASGKVGIGTSTPEGKLHILGTAGWPATSGTSTSVPIRLAGTSSALDFGLHTGTSWIQATDRTDQSVNNKLLLNPNGGIVAVGTTAPTAGVAPFVVSTATPATSLMAHALLVSNETTGAAGTGGRIAFGGSDGGGTSRMWASVSGFKENSTISDLNSYLTFSTRDNTSMSEQMRITSTGNVGIGLSNPSVKLEVNGTVKATAFDGPVTATKSSNGAGTSSAPSITFSGDNDTGFYNTSSNNTISVTTGGTNIFNFSSLGIVSPTTGGGSVSTANGTAATPTFSFAGDTDTGWFRPAADTLAASTGGSERVRIDSSGRWGMGTTTPTKLLDIYNPSSSAEVVLSNGVGGAVGNYLKLMTSRPDLTKDTSTTTYGSGNKSWAIGALSDTHASYPGSLIFMRNDDASQPTRMILSSDGNLGVGVLTPAQKLEIGAGNIKIDNGFGLGANFSASSMAAYYPYLTGMNSKAGLGPVMAYDEASYIVSDQVIAFGEADGDTVVGAMDVNSRRFYWDGNLGLGTQGVASSRFHIVNSAGADAGDDIRIDAYGTTTPAILMYRARGTYAAPTAVLDGDYLGSFIATGYNGSTFVRSATISSMASNDWTTTASTNNAYLSFKVTSAGTNTERMVLSDTGKLGLGTNVPASLLSLNGGGSSNWQMAVYGQTTGTGTYGVVHRDSANVNVFWTRDDGGVYARSMGVGASPDTNYAVRTAGNLYVVGSAANCTLGNAAGGVSCTSDARLKENVVNIPDSLEKILAIRGVEFDWNAASGKKGQHATGVIAQEVEKQFPSLVHMEKTSGYRTVDYAGLVAPIIEAIKEMYARYLTTEGRVAKLESEKQELQAQMQSQSRELASEKKRNDELERRLKVIEEKIK